MREIKFRAFIKYGIKKSDLKDPRNVSEIKDTGFGFMGTPDLIDFENNRIKYDTDWYEADQFKLMQYTGLKDRNGHEIYEGDIVHGTRIYDDDMVETTGEVVFDLFELFIKNNAGTYDPFLLYYDGIYPSELAEMKVIGNIFENPELFESQNAKDIVELSRILRGEIKMLSNVSIMENKVPVHVFSTINEWMDYVFIVDKENAEKAAEILDTAFSDWFNTGTSEAYGDWLCEALTNAGIEHEMFGKCEDEDD